MRELSERFAMAKEEIRQILTEAGIAPKPEGWYSPAFQKLPPQEPHFGAVCGGFSFFKFLVLFRAFCGILHLTAGIFHFSAD